jgi:hypothetical protein
MADAAIQRKRVAQAAPETVATVQPLSGEGVAGRTITPLKGASDLARYVPTEAVALYVVILAGAFATPTLSGNQKLYQLDYTTRWRFFGVMLVVTAALSWLIYAAKTRSTDHTPHDVPVFEMIIAVVAMAAWAAALPDSPFADFKWYGGWFPPIVLGTATALIPLIAQALGKTAPTYLEADSSGGDDGGGDGGGGSASGETSTTNGGGGVSVLPDPAASPPLTPEAAVPSPPIADAPPSAPENPEEAVPPEPVEPETPA